MGSAVSEGQKLRELFAGREARPVYLYAANGANRLYSRMFAPHVFDIPEDPASGSANGPLGALAGQVRPRVSHAEGVDHQRAGSEDGPAERDHDRGHV
ncbi:MAG TPA: PhzF family phenazine biosynthesis protein [Candidatus Dormibacteraeota bacterium]|nr:PhzF family phenazine biosynthesis protein [Candidatus Dormibacteraeota bacterium]